ncbi:MAG TPA: WXG100 family type VII secretion target [Streptosporangiaceae bacterium]|jgi:WXG100 family type VII secretion target
MASTVGGQLDEMAQLSKTFNSNGSQALQIKSAIERALAGTTWTGPAAERFRDAWQQFSPSLDKLSQALAEAGREVEQRRRALEQATS